MLISQSNNLISRPCVYWTLLIELLCSWSVSSLGFGKLLIKLALKLNFLNQDTTQAGIGYENQGKTGGSQPVFYTGRQQWIIADADLPHRNPGGERIYLAHFYTFLTLQNCLKVHCLLGKWRRSHLSDRSSQQVIRCNIIMKILKNLRHTLFIYCMYCIIYQGLENCA